VTADDDRFGALLDHRIALQEAKIAALLDGIEQMRTARSLTTSDDEHDPEGSMVSLDQARDAALAVQATAAMEELRLARDRVADRSYGTCERCGRPVPAARLEVRPEARLCVPCSERAAQL